MIIKKQRLHDALHYSLILLYATSLPFFLHIGNYVLGALLLNWLIEGNFKQKFSLFAASTPARLLSGFLLVFIISLAYSSNLSTGISDIERKLGLLFLPLLIFSKQPPSPVFFKNTLLGFGVGSVFGTSIALIIAFTKYHATGDASHLFYHQLSYNIGMHAVYLSCYLCFSVFIFIEYFRERYGKWSLSTKLTLTLLLLYIFVLLILLASKTMLAAFAVVFSIYLLFIGSSANLKRTVGIVFTLNILLVLAVAVTPYTRDRFEDAINSNLKVLDQERFEYDSEFTGLSIRLLFWKISTEVLNQESAWVQGVGTGDSQDKLAERYKQYNLYGGDGKSDTGYMRYNTHSLFFEVLLRVGLIGLLYLLVLLAYPLFLSFKRKQALLLVWILLFILFSVTEATLQLNKGVVYFAFFYSFLLQGTLKQPKSESSI